MKSLTVRLPDRLVNEIEKESRERSKSKSDIVRERLQTRPPGAPPAGNLSLIADLIGSWDGMPSDLSSRKKAYLKSTGYGLNRNR